jgi:DnaJ domain
LAKHLHNIHGVSKISRGIGKNNRIEGRPWSPGIEAGNRQLATEVRQIIMSYHSFSLDPRTVLGVSSTASMDEVHEAYRAKSKKHHPDLGGDEWAFRMVTRAYEVLKTISSTPSSQLWDSRVVNRSTVRPRPAWTWTGATPFGDSGAPFSFVDDSAKGPQSDHDSGPGTGENDRSDRGTRAAEETGLDLEDFRTVDVELIWTRFEIETAKRILSPQEEQDATLSVCLVISWPAEHLVEQATQVDAAGDILRNLIDLFERLRGQSSVVSGRSRIEDGQFVGWLSYPDVLTAQDAFLSLRATFQSQGLTARLQTRDERIPFDWSGRLHQPVMSQAS